MEENAIATDVELFFQEWSARVPRERRSLDRARMLADRLGLTSIKTPMLTVVGSKGKGTAAAYASGYLSAAGTRVVTVTSPSYRTNRERIRVDGLALSTRAMARLSERVADAMRALPRPEPGTGYLAPGGLFTLAGVLHADAVGADAIVLEAGRGGRSDEASLFAPLVAAITPIFEEHLGELGGTVAEIAADKAAIVGLDTKAVVSAPQRAEITEVIREAVDTESGGGATVDFPTPYTSGLPRSLLSPGLGAVNAELGCRAAQRLLDLTMSGNPGQAELHVVLASIALPGRLSWHRPAGGETTILLDQAVNRAGAAAALALARAREGGVDHVLLSLPDDKDLEGVIAELAGADVTFVELNRPHLTFSHRLPAHWNRIGEAELTIDLPARLGRRVVALGTVSFVGLVLDLLDAETERLFTPAQ